MMGALEPDVAALLARIEAARRPRFETLGVEDARALYRAGRETLQLERIPLAAVEDFVLAGRPARRFHPADAGPLTVLFFHGGGYVIGDLDTHDGICRLLAAAARSDVIAIEYRLAPEHPFPAAFDDCLAAWNALAATGPLAIAGDSAGATLAIAVALATQNTPPVALALFYPLTDVAAEAVSYLSAGNVPIGAETMRWFWAHAFPDEQARSDWRASPLRAADLTGLPPTYITVAGHDPLHDEGVAFAGKLQAAGVPVTLRELPGQIHGYLTLGRAIGEAKRSLLEAARFLGDRALHDTGLHSSR